MASREERIQELAERLKANERRAQALSEKIDRWSQQIAILQFCVERQAREERVPVILGASTKLELCGICRQPERVDTDDAISICPHGMALATANPWRLAHGE